MADFGLAKAVQGFADPRVTGTGVVLGSPYYMSPEQAEEGDVGFASDIYSLGIVLYEMLTGSPPSEGDSYGALINRHLAGKLPDLAAVRPDVPPEVSDLYRRQSLVQEFTGSRLGKVNIGAPLTLTVDPVSAPLPDNPPVPRPTALTDEQPGPLTISG